MNTILLAGRDIKMWKVLTHIHYVYVHTFPSEMPGENGEDFIAPGVLIIILNSKRRRSNMRYKYVTIILTSLILISGCTESGDKEYQKLHNRINSLERTMEKRKINTENVFLNMQQRYNMLLQKVAILENNVFGNRNVVIDPTKPGITKLETPVGFFLVAPGKGEQAAGVYKLKLQIGNPSSITYNGLTLQAVWGRKYSGKTQSDFESWKASLKQKENLFTHSLIPGTWAVVDMDLENDSGQIPGFIQISMQVGSINLQQNKK